MLDDLIPITWIPWLVGIAGATVVAVAGMMLTDIGPWYRALRKPSWQPPDWAFGPAWTLIFTAAVFSGVEAWTRAGDETTRTTVLVLFAINGLANMAWSWLFFTRKRPDWALLEIPVLWLSIATPIVVFLPFAPLASALLVPYLLWVSFAGFLNWTIVRLNPAFA